MDIKPKLKEYCSITEALEYLAYKKLPYHGNDGELVYPDFTRYQVSRDKPTRKDCLSDDEYEYKLKMHYAKAGLENIIRENSEIELYGMQALYVINTKNYVLDKKENEEEYNQIFDSMQHPNIDEVSIYGEIDYGTKEYSPNQIKFKNTLGAVVYKDPYLKFEQIKEYTLPNKEIQYVNKAIDDTMYTTLEIQIINALIANPEYLKKINTRGMKGKEDAQEVVKDVIKKLKLNVKYTKTHIAEILSVVKSPEAKKSGANPTF